MPAVQRFWTAAEVRRLIDEHPEPTPRMELVNGELLVSPSPNRLHQRIVRELLIALSAYVDRCAIGEVLSSPSDIDLAPELVVQPDLYVVPLVDGKRQYWRVPVTRILLAVEVLSPGTARFDRIIKRRAYQQAGVPEYWIVDHDARVVERWRPADERPEILDQELAWLPDGSTEPFTLDLARFFADQIDDPVR